MDDLLLVKIGVALGLALPFALVFALIYRRWSAVAAWNGSPEGKRYNEALGGWLLGKARLERAEPVDQPPVYRVDYRRIGRSRVFIREERRAMRLQIRLLPVGGGEVLTEDVVTIPAEELGELAPGRIYSALYDPRDPRRFYVDTLRRDQILLDGATLRTRAAEENHRAALAFSASPAPPPRG